MRSLTPTIHCDAQDGECGAWDLDFYKASVTAVDGVRVTEQGRAPGWLTTDEEDLCPDHRGDRP